MKDEVREYLEDIRDEAYDLKALTEQEQTEEQTEQTGSHLN